MVARRSSLAASLALLASCSGEPARVHAFSGPTMGSTYELKVVGTSKEAAAARNVVELGVRFRSVLDAPRGVGGQARAPPPRDARAVDPRRLGPEEHESVRWRPRCVGHERQAAHSLSRLRADRRRGHVHEGGQLRLRPLPPPRARGAGSSTRTPAEPSLPPHSTSFVLLHPQASNRNPGYSRTPPPRSARGRRSS